MKTQELRKLIREEVKKTLTEAATLENVVYEGTYQLVKVGNNKYQITFDNLPTNDPSFGPNNPMISVNFEKGKVSVTQGGNLKTYQNAILKAISNNINRVDKKELELNKKATNKSYRLEKGKVYISPDDIE